MHAACCMCIMYNGSDIETKLVTIILARISMDLSYILSLDNSDHYIQLDNCSNEDFELYCICQKYRSLHSNMDLENMGIPRRDHQSNHLYTYTKKYL